MVSVGAKGGKIKLLWLRFGQVGKETSRVGGTGDDVKMPNWENYV